MPIHVEFVVHNVKVGHILWKYFSSPLSELFQEMLHTHLIYHWHYTITDIDNDKE
jgi:hypothetical protein